MKRLLYKLWSTLLRWFGYIGLRGPGIPMRYIRELERSAQPMDIVFRRYRLYPDNWLILLADWWHNRVNRASGWRYGHSGVCIGQVGYVIHAVGSGVEQIEIGDFVRDSDGFALMRPRIKNPEAGIAYAMQRIGTPYDFAMDGNDDTELYCHELSYKTLQRAECEELPPRTKHIVAADLLPVGDVLMEV